MAALNDYEQTMALSSFLVVWHNGRSNTTSFLISSDPVAQHRMLTLNASTVLIGKKSWICISLTTLMRFAISLSYGSILTMLNALITR